MSKFLVFHLMCVALFGGCIAVPPAPNRSVPDPSDPSAPEASARAFRPNLVASTKVFLDPSVGEGAQQMGMGGMDHSKMQGMDHSNMPGTGTPQPSAQQSGGMKGMDHSKMPGMATPPPSKEALEKEMKKTSDEMKKLSDELKAKFDQAKGAENSQQQPSPSHSSDHGQMQDRGMSRAPAKQSQGNVIYTCPMHPEVKSDKSGDCPKCGMKLVRKSAAQ